MDFEEFFEKYQKLLAKNKILKEENEALKARFRLNGSIEQGVATPCSIFTNPIEKISLFMSLFKGRDDVYAKRWQSKNGRSGYTPVCLNEWKSSLCRKPAVKCFDCPHTSYNVLDEQVIEAHLRGSIIAGIYPMCEDEIV
jgi:hypothetical protein